VHGVNTRQEDTRWSG